MKKIFYILTMIILITSCKKNSEPEPGTDVTFRVFKDIDGNVYDVAQLANIYYLKQNLKTSRYRNGDLIPQIISGAEWATLTYGAWCWYNNDSAKYAATYGKLYNWYAVNDPRGLAPTDWFILKDEGKQQENDFTFLSNAYGGDGFAGGYLKDTGTLLWKTPNVGATNSYNFTGLPGGIRGSNGGFGNVGAYGCFWSATEDNPGAFYRFLYYNATNFTKASADKRSGFSVRCAKYL